MSEKRPNVIWIFGDQHRAQALGSAGDPNIFTPNLDRLADDGLNITGAVCNTPLCSPARGTLLTGRQPHHAVDRHQGQLPPEMPTVAHAFKDAGYKTGYIGKWHVDGFQEGRKRASDHIIPPDRRGGFDHWVGYENNNSQWDCWVHGGEGDDAFHERLPGFETDALTDLFMAHLEERAGGEEPFFAALSVQPPHDPYLAPEEFMARHTPGQVELRENVPSIDRVEERARREIAGYCAAVENLDWNVGRIRAKLDELGIADETHIIFFSDHGDMLGSHGHFRKTSPYEESVRVPLIIGGAVPRYELRGGRSSAPVSLVDIAPTSLGLCGIEVPDGMDGKDWSGMRRFGEDPDGPEAALISLHVPTGHGDSIDRPWRGIVTRDGWKYAVLDGQPWLMFNLNEDPYEQVNLALNPGHADERRRLQKLLLREMEAVGDHFHLPVL